MAGACVCHLQKLAPLCAEHDCNVPQSLGISLRPRPLPRPAMSAPAQGNERLLKLYESGLPSWAVFMPAYGLYYRCGTGGRGRAGKQAGRQATGQPQQLRQRR